MSSILPVRRLFVSVLLFAALIALFLAAAPARAASAAEIDREVDQALEAFRQIDGGEYGEGALRVGGKTVDYYSTAAASIGFQLGAQAKSIVVIFTEESALRKFRQSEGWRVGVDGSVALVDIGIGKAVDTTNIKDPVIGFIFGQKGLMYNLTLEGSKFTKLDKK